MRTFAVILNAAVLCAAIGCESSNNKKASAGQQNSTADLRSTTPPPPPPMIQPVQPVQPIQPVVSDTPVTVTPAVTTPTPSISGSTYTVQKGDTLFKIARAKYGDPSAVKKIKEANPGIDADHIRVGQKINLP